MEEGCPSHRKAKPHPHKRSSPTHTAAATGAGAHQGPLLLGGVDLGAEQGLLVLGLTSMLALPGQQSVDAMLTLPLARI